MNIIKSVKISGFRSFRDERLPSFGNYTALIGRNSCGKSNVLRALNLFFNSSTVNNDLIDFNKELHYRPSRKQKKRIRIAVEFSISDGFNFRKEVASIRNLGNTFTINRTWELDTARTLVSTYSITVDDREIEDSESIARSFLNLILYRYIPNRTIPAELLRKESQGIASAIFSRMKDSKKAEDVLKNLTTSAARILEPATHALGEAGSAIKSPTVATAATLGEMLTMSGFKATGLNGADIQDEDWGAGHQAFFLYNVLKELDTSYSRFFGWRQAVIWGVEEPESGLHHDLQTRLAKQLIDWSLSVQLKLQLLVSTHSPIFSMAAESGYWIDIDETSSSAQKMNPVELVRAAEDRGVSSYVHPALSFPWNPVIIVEGSIDEKALNHAAVLFGRTNLKFLALPSIDTAEIRGGKDAIRSYLKKNISIISKRPPEAPLMVLFDWDVSSDEIKQARSIYGKNSEDYVLKMDENNSNPQLSSDFKGIERFYPSSLMKAAHSSGQLTVGFPNNVGEPWTISSEQLAKAKNLLLQRLLNISDASAIVELGRTIDQVFISSQTFANKQRKLL